MKDVQAVFQVGEKSQGWWLEVVCSKVTPNEIISFADDLWRWKINLVANEPIHPDGIIDGVKTTHIGLSTVYFPDRYDLPPIIPASWNLSVMKDNFRSARTPPDGDIEWIMDEARSIHKQLNSLL